MHSLVCCAQLQADATQLQLSHSREAAQAVREAEGLRSALAAAQAARATAELRLAEQEATVAETRAALDGQERLLLRLRQQLTDEGSAMARAAELQATVQVGGWVLRTSQRDCRATTVGKRTCIDVCCAAHHRMWPTTLQVLERALQEQRQAASALRAEAAAAAGAAQAEASSLLAQLADKGRQLVDAERRFSQLEGLMARIAVRTETAGGAQQQGSCWGSPPPQAKQQHCPGSGGRGGSSGSAPLFSEGACARCGSASGSPGGCC